MILSFLFFTFVAYLAFKLVFDFIIPVAKTTKQVKKQFGEMNSRMQEQMNRQQAQQYQDNFSSKPSGEKKASGDDYIEYEEVK